MKFPDALVSGRLLRRYKRFLADVELQGGETVTAHCPNPGSMMGLAEPGMTVWLSRAQNPKRKLKYSWELVAADDTLVGINTGHPNGLVAEAIKAGTIPELADFENLRQEVRYGKNSRIDILLESEGAAPCYVEVKNVHLRRSPGLAEFPDSVTARGAKHLVELGDMVESGARAVMVYLVQRNDCESFKIAADIDPNYDKALGVALERGVEAICYACTVEPEGIEVTRALPVEV